MSAHLFCRRARRRQSPWAIEGQMVGNDVAPVRWIALTWINQEPEVAYD